MTQISFYLDSVRMYETKIDFESYLNSSNSGTFWIGGMKTLEKAIQFLKETLLELKFLK